MDTNPTDEDLVRIFIEGDEDAFHQLVNRYQSPLLNYLYRFTNKYELAEEVTQETFMAVFQNIKKFRLDASFRSWVYAIATNRACNSWRRQSPIFNDESVQSATSEMLDPIVKASEEERAKAVQQALANLPEKQRAIFILRFYQGLSYEEIALAIGCPVGTVKSRMCNTTAKLRGILWPYREK